MKETKTIISFFILTFALATLVSTASAGINVTDAEAIYEANLSAADIPTDPYPIETIFTCNIEAIFKQDLFSVSIPTQPLPIEEIFIINQEATFDTNLYTVSIPTEPLPIKEIFIINEEAKTSEELIFPMGLLNDTTSPTITNVTVSGITSNSATITWDTDEIADSLVKSGKQSGIYTESKADSLVVMNHTVVLTGLSQGTKYYFVVNSTDRDMNSNESIEDDFTTTPTGEDEIPPYTAGHEPAKGDVNVSIDTNIVVHVLDDNSGVNESTILMTVEGVDVSPVITGTSADYTLTYDPPVNFGYGQVVDVTVDAYDLAGNPMVQDAYSFIITTVGPQYFDTGEGTYPSIMGTHEGKIIPSSDIEVSKLYTYPCAGTGGHTESIELYENGDLKASGTWNGYQDDWHNITITPSVTLRDGYEYTYIIRTSSYPQIIHEHEYENATGGTITCSLFTDVNGRTYDNWIPAIRLYDLQN